MKELNALAHSLGITHVEYENTSDDTSLMETNRLARQFTFYRADGSFVDSQHLMAEHIELDQLARAFIDWLDERLPNGVLDTVILNTQSGAIKEFDSDGHHTHHAFVLARLEELGVTQLEAYYACFDLNYGVDLLQCTLKDDEGNTVELPQDAKYLNLFLSSLALNIQSQTDTDNGGEGLIRIRPSDSEAGGYTIALEHNRFSSEPEPMLEDHQLTHAESQTAQVLATLSGEFDPNVFLDVSFSNSDDIKAINVQVYTKDQEGNYEYQSSAMEDSVFKALEDYVWNALDTLVPSWEINNVSEGNLTFNLAEQSVVVNAYVNETETETTNFEWLIFKVLDYVPQRDGQWDVQAPVVNSPSPSL